MPATTLRWEFASKKPLVNSPGANSPTSVSRKCIVRTEHPTRSLIVATYIKPKAEGAEAYWQDDHGRKIEWKVLAWADLFDTEHALNIMFPAQENSPVAALTQAQKDQLSQDFNKKCDDIIANKIKLEHHANNQDFIKKNLLPDWTDFRDLRKSYVKNELLPQDMVFLDKLIDDNFARYTAGIDNHVIAPRPCLSGAVVNGD